MITQIKQRKEELEKEKALLETELGQVGHRNPDYPKDWEPTAEDINILRADENERADEQEDFTERSAIEHELEVRLKSITEALKRIEDGEYGICTICGEEIEERRLEANPAATTCLKHINKELS